MSTPQEIRQKRLLNDLHELETIKCSAIQWDAIGNPISTLHVTFNIHSIISVNSNGVIQYRDKHEIEIEIPSGYPFSASPSAKLREGYVTLFHPNFYPSGLVCTQTGKWTANETLALFVIRLAKMICFDPDITDPGNPANRSAATWYKANLGKGLFPTDNCYIPVIGADEDDSGFKITSQW